MGEGSVQGQGWAQAASLGGGWAGSCFPNRRRVGEHLHVGALPSGSSGKVCLPLGKLPQSSSISIIMRKKLIIEGKLT